MKRKFIKKVITILISCLCIIMIGGCIRKESKESEPLKQVSTIIDSTQPSTSKHPTPKRFEIREGGVTRVGMFNSPLQPLSDKYGSRGTRFGVSDKQMPNFTRTFLQGNYNEGVQKIVEFNQSEMATVITFSYPGTGGRHRVPVGQDRETVLSNIREFVQNLGPYISYIAVHNESYVGVGRFEEKDREADAEGKFPALEWLKTVAATIAEERAKNPKELGHLRIASCAFTCLYEYAHGIPAQFGDFKGIGPSPFTKALMEWVEQDPNIDVVDLHMHEATPQHCLDILNYAKSFTTKPFIVTEWSPSESKREFLESTIYEAARPFYDKYKEMFNLNEKVTNEKFIRSLYKKPTTKEIWDEYLSYWNFDPMFWKDGYDLMNEERMEMLCVGQYYQVESPIFDVKQIVADKTVELKDGQPQENYKFGEYFKDLTAYVKSLQK